MSRAPISGRERLLTTIRHEEPDRVPICPRIQWGWLDPDGSHRLQETCEPAVSHMDIRSSTTPNCVV